jgi:hypothetical protein
MGKQSRYRHADLRIGHDSTEQGRIFVALTAPEPGSGWLGADAALRTARFAGVHGAAGALGMVTNPHGEHPPMGKAESGIVAVFGRTARGGWSVVAAGTPGCRLFVLCPDQTMTHIRPEPEGTGPLAVTFGARVLLTQTPLAPPEAMERMIVGSVGELDPQCPDLLMVP